MCRERPGTGPAPVPSSTSLVPVASFNAACAGWAALVADGVCALARRGAAARAGTIDSPASRVRRESLSIMASLNFSGALLNDLIRPLQERRRDRQAEGRGGLEVD